MSCFRIGVEVELGALGHVPNTLRCEILIVEVLVEIVVEV